ncbi:MAG: hypothetical protein INR71_14865 [Terriglobus roseus]|nr:hypothetical protein [Terriglobus roseus]
MDVDREQTASPAASPMATSPAPLPTPGSFPETNGVVNGTNGDAERPPTPPQHGASPQPTREVAEVHKAAGNKFFKAKQYDKAIEEYSKGPSETV